MLGGVIVIGGVATVIVDPAHLRRLFRSSGDQTDAPRT